MSEEKKERRERSEEKLEDEPSVGSPGPGPMGTGDPEAGDSGPMGTESAEPNEDAASRDRTDEEDG